MCDLSLFSWPILPALLSLRFHDVAPKSASQLGLVRPDVRDGPREGLWISCLPFLF